MKTRSLLLALSSVAVISAVTGCSSLMPSSANGPEGTAPAATTAPPTKTYTADDLTAILTAAESSLGSPARSSTMPRSRLRRGS